MLFAKDPIKQSLHQNTAIKFIKNLENVIESKTLIMPTGGKNAFYLISGQLIEGKNLTTDKKPKSIDFLITLKNDKKIYCTHKYTKENGGSQDNQLNDVLNFMENSRTLSSKYIYCLAILDGEYYRKKIHNINKKYQTKNCMALTINDLQEYINNLL